MSKFIILRGLFAIVILGVAGFAGWVLSLPSEASESVALPLSPEETDKLLATLGTQRNERPVVAIIGLNDATEATDYLMPTGILRRADVADMVMVATAKGPVKLYPALTVEPDQTIAEFDAEYPEGADYVIVPAMSRDDDPAVLAWLQGQSRKGARIIGVCAGAKVVGEAGLLDGRRATTHWYYLGELLGRNPTIDYIADRRMVADGNVVTTTGITASMPVMLTLIEAIGGREKAEAVARGLGVESWDARHASGEFALTRSFAMTVLANRMAFWRREKIGLWLEPGLDEVSLALMADAWSRTYRSEAITFAASTSAVASANGVRILPDRTAPGPSDQFADVMVLNRRPAEALDLTLEAIAERYGDSTTDVVAMQLEYPRSN